MPVVPIKESGVAAQPNVAPHEPDNTPAVQPGENTLPSDLPRTNPREDRYSEGGDPLSAITGGLKHRQ